MNDKLENEFKEKFPNLFIDLNGDPTKTCMSEEHGGIAIANGWADLLKELCDNLNYVAGPDFKFAQIKEKFGQLRIYTDGGNKETNKLIDDAEYKSLTICEICGTRENVSLKGSWLRSLCTICRGD